MKIGVVGAGLVGSTAAYAMVMRGIVREIVLVDKEEHRAVAEVDDIFHAVPFAQPIKLNAGNYEDLAGSRVVIISAGVNQNAGEDRLHLLGRNAAIFRKLVPEVLRHAGDAVLVIATNPVDIMTHIAASCAEESGSPVTRVMGAGTTLDTARFRVLLSQYLNIDSHHIHAYVIGEHGDSEVLVWSRVTVGGIPLEEFCSLKKIRFDESARKEIDKRVRYAAYNIIRGKGATYYGIGSALARIVEVIVHDQRSILTVCSQIKEIAGISNVTVSLPHLIGGDGILAAFPPSLSAEEQSMLSDSAKMIRTELDKLGI